MTAVAEERITIRTHSPLAGRMVKALLTGGGRSDDTVHIAHEPNLVPPGVRLEIDGAANWLFLSLDSSPRAIVEALNAGAGGVLTMDSSPEDIEHGLATMRSNGVGYLPVEVLRQLARTSQGDDAGTDTRGHGEDGPVLTERELEVLRGVASGHSNADIASHLGISYHTVRSHMRALAIKLGTATRAEMLSRAPFVLRHHPGTN
jgi:DNA-binding NarL/FixJ family response regulator